MFFLNEMLEERNYNKAEAKLTALISESDIMNRNEYSIRNKELEEDREEEYSSLYHSIGIGGGGGGRGDLSYCLYV